MGGAGTVSRDVPAAGMGVPAGPGCTPAPHALTSALTPVCPHSAARESSRAPMGSHSSKPRIHQQLCQAQSPLPGWQSPSRLSLRQRLWGPLLPKTPSPKYCPWLTGDGPSRYLNGSFSPPHSPPWEQREYRQVQLPGLWPHPSWPCNSLQSSPWDQPEIPQSPGSFPTSPSPAPVPLPWLAPPANLWKIPCTRIPPPPPPGPASQTPTQAHPHPAPSAVSSPA